MLIPRICRLKNVCVTGEIYQYLKIQNYKHNVQYFSTYLYGQVAFTMTINARCQQVGQDKVLTIELRNNHVVGDVSDSPINNKDYL